MRTRQSQNRYHWYDNLQDCMVVTRSEGGRAEPLADIKFEFTRELD